MKVNYCFLVTDKVTSETSGDMVVKHVCLYEEKPCKSDLDHLIKELNSDETFGLTNEVYGVDYEVSFYEGEGMQKVKEVLNIPDEITD